MGKKQNNQNKSAPSAVAAAVAAVATAPVVSPLADIATCMTPKVKIGREGPPNTRVYLADGETELVLDANPATFKAYVRTYHAIAPANYKGGYKTFVTVNDAYTNIDMLNGFTVQGIAKQMALLATRAAEIILDGAQSDDQDVKDKGDAMKAALAGFTAYMQTVMNDAQAEREARAMDAAVAQIARASGISIEAAKAKLAALATPLPVAPPPPANADEPTIADADENADGAEKGETATANA